MTSINDINSICTPLFNNTEIDFFYYARCYKDNSYIILNSNGEFHQSVISDLSPDLFDWETLNNLITTKSSKLTKNTLRSYWLTEDLLPEKFFSRITNRFNVRTGIEIMEKFNDYCELSWFDSSSKKSLAGFYFNNVDILIKFILYFREKASRLINQNEKSKIILPYRDNKLKKITLEMCNKKYFKTSQLYRLHKMLNVKKYMINLEGKLVDITNREGECLLHLGTRHSAKKIASLMGISTKTVENHLQNLKTKLGVYTKEQLLSVYRGNLLSKISYDGEN